MQSLTSARREAARSREQSYKDAIKRIQALLDGESDWVAAMATVASELHHAFDHFDWTGFYRAIGDETLIIGPYQGGHGCLRISFDRGVCGAAARSLTTQLVRDVALFPGHIACSSETRSEIVVPVVAANGTLMAVLDVDSNIPDAFDEVDQRYLERICNDLGGQFSADVDGKSD